MSSHKNSNSCRDNHQCEHVTYTVCSDDFRQIFQMKKHTKLRKMMLAVEEMLGIDYKTIRFVFNGERMEDHQTPRDIGLKDGDVIELYQEQTGG